MEPTFDEVARSKYVSLTTFTKNGTPKPTPVWICPSPSGQGRYWIISESDAWKVKRIRNTPRVTLARCDFRGNVKGEAVEATATLLPSSDTAIVYDAINRRYGLIGRAFGFFSKLRGGMENNVGIEVRAAD
ncbi:PPOX class F420-dependent oxidoreductase [Gordonia sp. X0973]|uniref:PPOX class F420-dependent oxidoreductase n=1 Tax=Gordonia sp. X0973 TaxID=2742602 RepID=UPI000F537199|nr:PPOX class F420-dependent oxidoreductase [Gordonia sp. X0973]QKT08196.1 PPOX class F420-dependent oxidoreductase [Gordonia sp. X0973]